MRALSLILLLAAIAIPVAGCGGDDDSGGGSSGGGSSSGGASSDGTAAAELTAAVRPGQYHVVVITRRSNGGVRGAEVMRGKLNY